MAAILLGVLTPWFSSPRQTPARSGYYDTLRIDYSGKRQGEVRLYWSAAYRNWFASPFSFSPLSETRLWRGLAHPAALEPA